MNIQASMSQPHDKQMLKICLFKTIERKAKKFK